MIYKYRYGSCFLEYSGTKPEGSGYIHTGEMEEGEHPCLHVSLPPMGSVDNCDVVVGMIYRDCDPYKPLPEREPLTPYSHNGYFTSGGKVQGVNCYNLHILQPQGNSLWCYCFKSPSLDVVSGDVRNYKPDWPGYRVDANLCELAGSSKNAPITEELANVVAGQLPLNTADFDRELYTLCSELKFNSNNIANIQAIMDLVTNGLDPRKWAEDIIEMSARDAWLQYRYVYNTTKADIEEAVRLCRQISDRETGTLRTAFSSEGTDCHLKIRYKPMDNQFLALAHELLSLPNRFGIDPSLYNAWDMIPFSFIADWFLPVGNNLENLSNMVWTAKMPYDYYCLASQKGFVNYHGLPFTVYRRFRYSPTYELTVYSSDGSSAQTWGKRALDVWALTG